MTLQGTTFSIPFQLMSVTSFRRGGDRIQTLVFCIPVLFPSYCLPSIQGIIKNARAFDVQDPLKK